MEWCDGYVIDDVEGLVSSFQNFFEDLCDFSKINSCGESETHHHYHTLIYITLYRFEFEILISLHFLIFQ